MAKGNVIVVSQDVKSNLIEHSTRLTSIDSELDQLKTKMKELQRRRKDVYSSLETLANECGLFKENKGDSIPLSINPDTFEKTSLVFRTTQGYNPETGRPGAVRGMVVIVE